MGEIESSELEVNNESILAIPFIMTPPTYHGRSLTAEMALVDGEGCLVVGPTSWI